MSTPELGFTLRSGPAGPDFPIWECRPAVLLALWKADLPLHNLPLLPKQDLLHLQGPVLLCVFVRASEIVVCLL